MTHHEHHFRNLQRSRDHLTNAIQALRSATERMSYDDWIEARSLLAALEANARRLAALRARAEERFDEWSQHPEFDAMRMGEIPFPDERVKEPDVFGDRCPTCGETDNEICSSAWHLIKADRAQAHPPPLNGPNAQEGGRLANQHGGVDEAMRHYQPDSSEMDHLQAYRYVSTGRRPVGWVPPIVRAREGDDDA